MDKPLKIASPFTIVAVWVPDKINPGSELSYNLIVAIPEPSATFVPLPSINSTVGLKTSPASMSSSLFLNSNPWEPVTNICSSWLESSPLIIAFIVAWPVLIPGENLAEKIPLPSWNAGSIVPKSVWKVTV